MGLFKPPTKKAIRLDIYGKTFFSRLNEPPNFTNSKVTQSASQLHHQKCIHDPFYLLDRWVVDN